VERESSDVRERETPVVGADCKVTSDMGAIPKRLVPRDEAVGQAGRSGAGGLPGPPPVQRVASSVGVLPSVGSVSPWDTAECVYLDASRLPTNPTPANYESVRRDVTGVCEGLLKVWRDEVAHMTFMQEGLSTRVDASAQANKVLRGVIANQDRELEVLRGRAATDVREKAEREASAERAARQRDEAEKASVDAVPVGKASTSGTGGASVENFAALSSENLRDLVRAPGVQRVDHLLLALGIATAREVALAAAVGRMKPEIDPHVITIGSDDDEDRIKKEPGS